MSRLLLIPFLLLTGCASVEYVPYEVKVEVPVPCAAEVPPEPAWKTNNLKKTDDIDVKVDGLLAERQQRIGYEKQLRAAIEGCK